ncbi:E3 ubiquitin-protein ligase NRDP1-like, partial [Actinia tenebrosa]|uniref:E3 ubiquitin-protein ligase NRDP1-like n=1 Tax=Actinia tenebrosa TaxID=6105 RepID=A0A6P8IYQ5_ACTTE
MEGYKTEQFVDKIDDNLLCPICHDVLRDPIMSCEEGHSFCRYCIGQWLRSVDRCPLDNSLIEDRNFSRNLTVRGVIDNLKVYCHPQREDKNHNQESAPVDVGSIDAAQKCTWIGKLGTLPKHQQTCP